MDHSWCVSQLRVWITPREIDHYGCASRPMMWTISSVLLVVYHSPLLVTWWELESCQRASFSYRIHLLTPSIHFLLHIFNSGSFRFTDIPEIREYRRHSGNGPWLGRLDDACMIILTPLDNISPETPFRAEDMTRVSRYWIKREQAVLGLLKKWSQKTSSRKLENRSFFSQILSIARPRGNVCSMVVWSGSLSKAVR